MPAGLLHDESLLVGGLLVVLLVGVALARLRIVGRLLQLAIWGVLIWALAGVLGERARFDPLLGRLRTYFAPADMQTVSGREVRVRIARDGHFWVRASLNGVPRRLLVDSGATVTALSAATAKAAGIEVHAPLMPVLLHTANGTIPARTGTMRSLRFGTVVAHDLPVVVSPAFGDTDVLGMNFLTRLKSWRVEDGVLVLTPHHPRAVAAGG